MGIKIDSREDTFVKRRSPFFHACANGLLDVVKLMIQGSTTVNSKCSVSGMTALHVACLGGDVQLFDWLLSHPDIDVNAIDKDGRTALHYLCRSLDPLLPSVIQIQQVQRQKHQLQLLQTLIKNAKDLNLNFNVKTLNSHYDGLPLLHEGQTPFLEACEYGTYDVVKLLMENVDRCGIDINAVNGRNRNGLDLTKRRGKKFVRLIQGRGDNGILWKLRDFFSAFGDHCSAFYEDEKLLTIFLVLALLFIAYSILEELWVWIFNDCDMEMECYFWTERSLLLGLQIHLCYTYC